MQHTIGLDPSGKREDLNSCRLIEAVCFAVFLPIAFLAMLCGWRWQPWPPGPDGYGSVLSEARSMARTIAGIAISV